MRQRLTIKHTGWARFDPSLPGSKPIAKKTVDTWGPQPEEPPERRRFRRYDRGEPVVVVKEAAE